MKIAINLDNRFLEPPGWEWGFFTRAGRQIRFGHLIPPNPSATIILLTGLSEFAEKYFETARDLLNMNCAVWVMDWYGQGLSGRYLDNPHKRHSTGFDEDLADLHEFVTLHVQPNASGPLILIAHSMGGNIGLQYLHDHPDVFKAAAFSAPMCGIKTLSFLPMPFLNTLTAMLKCGASECYIGLGDGNWRAEMRELKGFDPFSSDPLRRTVHNHWCLADPRLQVGRVTYSWVYHAVRACQKLQTAFKENPPAIPILFALAGRETLVDNEAARKLAQTGKNIQILELPQSRHEILMERDAIRGQFLTALQALITPPIP